MDSSSPAMVTRMKLGLIRLFATTRADTMLREAGFTNLARLAMTGCSLINCYSYLIR